MYVCAQCPLFRCIKLCPVFLSDWPSVDQQDASFASVSCPFPKASPSFPAERGEGPAAKGQHINNTYCRTICPIYAFLSASWKYSKLTPRYTWTSHQKLSQCRYTLAKVTQTNISIIISFFLFNRCVAFLLEKTIQNCSPPMLIVSIFIMSPRISHDSTSLLSHSYLQPIHVQSYN